MFSHAAISLVALSSLFSSTLAKTVKFELDVTWGKQSGVGEEKTGFILNKQSPGPALTLTVGDTVEFTVNNESPYNTSVHFHGITQLGTPWSDGVPGVSQYPIAPNSTFHYKWTADEYGTYWYHSHYKGQIMDGFYGPIYIQPSEAEPRPFGLISNSSSDVAAMKAAEKSPNILLLSDWNRDTFHDLFTAEQASGVDFTCPDAVIINGKGSVVCLGQSYYETLAGPQLLAALNGTQITAKGCLPPIPAVQGNYTHNLANLPPSAFDVCTPTSGEVEVISVDPASGWASINLIGASGISTLEVSVDNHKMYVYSADGLYIVPQMVDAVTVTPGTRYAAMIKLDQTPGNYSIRAAIAGNNKFDTGYGILAYKGGAAVTSTPSIAYNGLNLTAAFIPFVDAKIRPLQAIAPGNADQTVIVDIGTFKASYLWSLSGTEGYNLTSEEELTPLLFDPNQPVASDPGVAIKTVNGTWVDIILTVHPSGPSHLIHKHSNKAFVIGQGIGPFNYSSVAQAMQYIPQNFNLVNPPQRDGFSTPPAIKNATWTAIRYQVVNPGAFIIHCHIQTHFSGGMAMAILDGAADFPQIPKSYDVTYGNDSFSSTTSSASSTSFGPTKSVASATASASSSAVTGAASLNKPAAVLMGGVLALLALA